jgi:hypothetical protein
MHGRSVSLGLLLLLAACSAGDDGTDPGGTSTVQLVDGQAVCDSCFSVRIRLSGDGVQNVDEVQLVEGDAARTPVPARIVLARESGDAGDILAVTAYFDAGIAEGEFDLLLDPGSGGDRARLVKAALLVTRGRLGTGALASVRAWVQVTGTDRDGRFTLRTVAGCAADACAPVPVEAYEAAMQSLPAGLYTFRLDDVADNCTVSGMPNPATLTLQRGVRTALSYVITCVPMTNPAWVRVANVTTGADLDDAYDVSCSSYSCLPFHLTANRDTVLRVVPGEVTISLADVSSNCTRAGDASVSATAVAADTAIVTFNVTCTPEAGIRATVRVAGRDLDTGLAVRICAPGFGVPDCSVQYAAPGVPTTFLNLPSNSYSVSVLDLAPNCALVGPDTYNVQVQNSIVEVGFDVQCQAPGTVRVSVVTTGTKQDTDYWVLYPTGCDGWYYYECEQNTLTTAGSVDFRVLPGVRSFTLGDVASNCVVLPPGNPRSVTAIEDAVVELRFEVACQ